MAALTSAAIAARQHLRRIDWADAAVRRLQPLITRLEDHLRMELLDATRSGDNNRRLLAEAELDELFRIANEAVHEGRRP